jgi:hypothetical protein
MEPMSLPRFLLVSEVPRFCDFERRILTAKKAITTLPVIVSSLGDAVQTTATLATPASTAAMA